MNCLSVFLRNKTYREEGCLIYPTLEMLHFVESLEEIFNTRFESIIGTPGILATLCKSADREVRFLNCKRFMHPKVASHDKIVHEGENTPCNKNV